MNILLANESGLDQGGVCHFMLLWVRAVLEADCNCSIFVYFRGAVSSKNNQREYERLGVKIIVGNIPTNITMKDTKYRTALKQDIRRIISENQINVIHVNSGVFGFTNLILTEAVKAGVEIRVSHVHGKYYESPLNKIVHSVLRMKINKQATVCAGCSIDAGEYMYGKRGVQSSKWQFIPNTIQTTKFTFCSDLRQQRRAQLDVCEDEFLLGAVGRLVPMKNHTLLLHVVSDLKKEGIEATLLILGDGKIKSDLQKQATELGIDKKIILFGNTDDVAGWLSAMDYFLMPSLSEGLPISAVEAQANGLVCLLSDRISKEVDLCEDVYHLSIDNGTEPWVRQIAQTPPKSLEKRLLGAEVVRDAGFDAVDMPRYVKNIYGWK